ncbi:unnamed protein product [Colletotrichum noveboracense]|uniref:Uncharacterized protein n=1 Tax=Colletotrichum noveboracense TaxID=2664923 RepID=A0A9W4RLK8_9PEZI|nr:unnamed protein product [Colletotrichum noveboracense]
MDAMHPHSDTNDAFMLSSIDPQRNAPGSDASNDPTGPESLHTTDTAVGPLDDEPCETRQEELLPLKANPADQTNENNEVIDHSHQNTESLWKECCLLAIAIILSIHQGQPLPNWPDLISINSLVAIFTAIFKASLIMPVAAGEPTSTPPLHARESQSNHRAEQRHWKKNADDFVMSGLGQLKWEWFKNPRTLADVVLFDDASRGPWGSLMLIVKQPLPLKHSYVASIGALITIAALAIDPFSQAMVEYRTCPQILAHETAEIARTNNYSAGSGHYMTSYAEAALDFSMLTALHNGLVDSEETESLINIKCTTGNCTFGDMDHGEFFSSLAMCHSCHDITHEVAPNKSHYQLPSGPAIAREFRGEVLSAMDLDFEDTEAATFFHFETLMLRKTECQFNCRTDSNIEPLAVRCTLTPCVERYRAEVRNGIYREMKSKTPGKELKKCPVNPLSDRRQVAYALVTNSSLVDGVERPCNPLTERVPNSVMLDAKSNAIPGLAEGVVNDPEWKFYPQECVWTFDMTCWYGIKFVLRRLLRDNVMIDVGMTGGPYNSDGPLWLKAMYNQGNGSISTVENVVRGLANSMSAVIRNKPTIGQQALEEIPTTMKKVSGTVEITQTCIYVQWGWIAYPATLLVLQAVFSVMVLAGPRMTRSRSGPRYSAWKSSPLALLFYGLDGDVRRKNTDLRTVDQMDKVAQKVKVQLSHVDDVDKGWRFCESSVETRSGEERENRVVMIFN